MSVDPVRPAREPLTIAVPKGRILKALVPLFERAGLTVAEVSTRLIANRAAYKLRADVIQPFVERLRRALGSETPAPSS